MSSHCDVSFHFVTFVKHNCNPAFKKHRPVRDLPGDGLLQEVQSATVFANSRYKCCASFWLNLQCVIYNQLTASNLFCANFHLDGTKHGMEATLTRLSN